MSLFRKQSAELRAVSSIAGWERGDDVASRSSMTSALGVVPVFAAMRLIVDAISSLPLQQYRKTPAGAREQVQLAPVFDFDTRIEWTQQALTSMLIRGNGVGLTTSFNSGFPGRVVWLNPEDVQVDESGSLPVWRYKGREVDRQLIKHLPAYSLPGSIWGLSPIGACSSLVSVGSSTQKMMSDWYKGRALPGSTFQNTARTIDPADATAVSDRLSARLRNGKPLVYGADWKFEAVSMSADDAAFIESSKLNANQVASIYGIPPEMIGGESGSSMTYSTTEQQAINFATYTLRPWVSKLEQEFSAWLPDRQFVRFNMDAMIRVDTKTRHEVYRIAREIGLNSTDELRTREDLAPLPDGAGESYSALNDSAESPARLIQQMYLGVGKVITAKEAREILKQAGAFIDDGVTLDELHQSLPPNPDAGEPAAK